MVECMHHYNSIQVLMEYDALLTYFIDLFGPFLIQTLMNSKLKNKMS